jgi:hypothetical protein
MTKKGILYSRCLLTHKWICKIDVIGLLACLLYPLTGTGLFSVSNRVFKNSEIFLAHLVLRRAKAFALVLANAVVLTLHLLQYKVHEIVKPFLLNNQLRLTSNILILYSPKEESSFRALLFLTYLIRCLTLHPLPRPQELDL